VKIPPQISRLILLTLLIVATYFIARYFLVPESFGQYGWYRGAALEEIASLEPTYAGSKSCEDCHSDQVTVKAKGAHKTIRCESCHGPALAHTEDPNISPPKLDAKFCLRCHTAEPARPAKFPQINPADHYSDQTCRDCHLPHAPNEAPKQ
jgi:hypothetical protein